MKKYKAIWLYEKDIHRLHLVYMEGCKLEKKHPVAMLYNLDVIPALAEQMMVGKLPETIECARFPESEIKKLSFICNRHKWRDNKPILDNQKYNGDWEALLEDIGMNLQEDVVSFRDT